MTKKEREKKREEARDAIVGQKRRLMSNQVVDIEMYADRAWGMAAAFNALGEDDLCDQASDLLLAAQIIIKGRKGNV